MLCSLSEHSIVLLRVLFFKIQRSSNYLQFVVSMSAEVTNLKRRLSCEDELIEGNDDLPNVESKVKKAKIPSEPSTSSAPVRNKRIIESKPLENPVIYIENGLRKVRPYWFKYMTSTKGRWVKKKLIDVLHKEFHGKTDDFFNVAIQSGRLTVSGKRTSLDHVFGPNDFLTNVAHRHELPVLDKPIKILVNNEDVVVVDKPCSLPVHPCGRYFYNSLTQILKNEHNLADLRLMYRLDRLTSGLVILSKHSEIDLKLKSEISQRAVSKEYVCLIEGEFPSEPIECSKSIEPCERRMGVQWIVPEGSSTGKQCVTRFELIKTNKKVSVVRCKPETGRTHQIRVHLQYLGFPIVNDYMYNNTVWGPYKGKGANYCKTVDQLKKDIVDEFGAQNWIIDFEESKANFMEHKERLNSADDNSGAILDLDRIVWTDKPSSTTYDPYCIDCHVTARIPTEEDLLMYLHCLKYKGSDWEYETDLPEWAKKL